MVKAFPHDGEAEASASWMKAEASFLPNILRMIFKNFIKEIRLKWIQKEAVEELKPKEKVISRSLEKTKHTHTPKHVLALQVGLRDIYYQMHFHNGFREIFWDILIKRPV